MSILEVVKIYVVRHGPAEDTATSGKDFDRVLTPSGRERVREVARALGKADDARSRAGRRLGIAPAQLGDAEAQARDARRSPARPHDIGRDGHRRAISVRHDEGHGRRFARRRRRTREAPLRVGPENARAPQARVTTPAHIDFWLEIRSILHVEPESVTP